MKARQFQLYTALFQPKIINNIREEMRPLIGQKITVKALYVNDNNGSYPNQMVFQVTEAGKYSNKYTYWIPEEDLIGLTPYKPSKD